MTRPDKVAAGIGPLPGPPPLPRSSPAAAPAPPPAADLHAARMATLASGRPGAFLDRHIGPAVSSALDNTIGRASRMVQAPFVGGGGSLATAAGGVMGGGRAIGRANPGWWDHFWDAMVGEGTRATGAAWNQLASLGGHQVDREFARTAAGLRQGGSPLAARALEAGQSAYNLGAQVAVGGLAGRAAGATMPRVTPAPPPPGAQVAYMGVPPRALLGPAPASAGGGGAGAAGQAAGGAGWWSRLGGAAANTWRRTPGIVKWPVTAGAAAIGSMAPFVGAGIAADKVQQWTGTGDYAPDARFDRARLGFARPSFQESLAAARTPAERTGLLRGTFDEALPHAASVLKTTPEVLRQKYLADNQISDDEMRAVLNPAAAGSGGGGGGGTAQGPSAWNPWTMIGAPLGIYGLLQLLRGKGGMEALLPLLLGGGMAAHGSGTVDFGQRASQLGGLFGGEGQGQGQGDAARAAGPAAAAMPDDRWDALLRRAYAGDTGAQDALARAEYSRYPGWLVNLRNDAYRMFRPNAVRDEIAATVKEKAQRYLDQAAAAGG